MTIESEEGSDHIGVSPETPLPESFTDDENAPRCVDFGLFPSEPAPARRGDSKDIKVVIRNH